VKEIDRTIPSRFTKLEKRSELYFDKISIIFKDQDFYNKIENIRSKFNIPSNGIREFRGVVESGDKFLTSEAIKMLDKKNSNKFADYLSLVNNKVLKRPGYQVNRKKQLFQKEITLLLRFFDLPERFRDAFTQYLIFNKLPLISSYSFPCSIIVYKDKSIKRLFIELYGDTKREHIREAWRTVKSRRDKHKHDMVDSTLANRNVIKLNKIKKIITVEIFRNTEKKHVDLIWSKIEKLIKGSKIPGGQLFRCKYFYPMRFSGEYVLDKEDKPLRDERVERLNEMFYDEKNLYIWRHKRYLSKYKA